MPTTAACEEEEEEVNTWSTWFAEPEEREVERQVVQSMTKPESESEPEDTSDPEVDEIVGKFLAQL